LPKDPEAVEKFWNLLAGAGLKALAGKKVAQVAGGAAAGSLASTAGSAATSAAAAAGKKGLKAKIADKITESKEDPKMQMLGAAQQSLDQNRMATQQQKRDQEQRASEMARSKADTSTGGAFSKAWMTIKGQTFHPSIVEHLKERTPRRGEVEVAPRPSPFPNQPDEPVNVETQRGTPAVDEQGFTTLPQQQSDAIQPGDMPRGSAKKVAVGGAQPIGNLNHTMFFNRGHLRERENRLEGEGDEVKEIMAHYASKLIGPDGRYLPNANKTVSVKTHHLDKPRTAADGSRGDTIVATIRPHDNHPDYPQLHTVMYRGSNQPFDLEWAKRFNVEKIINHVRKVRLKNRLKKSENLNSILVKERKTPEAMRHKREYDAQYNKRPTQVKYREDLNRERRRRGIMGSHDHMDVSHTQGGKLTLEPEHSNRARHWKDKGTLRVVKSMKDDLELLRNLLQGPMDEQDKKIANATLTMIEEQDNDEEEEELSRPLHGGGHLFV